LKVTRRRFLFSGAAAMGATTVVPAALPEILSSGRSNHLDAVNTVSDWASASIPVKIDIAAAQPVRVMAGGIGASIHAINAELPGRKPSGGSSWSGSEWGGNPAGSDSRHWDDLFRHADWLGMDFCRVEFEQRIYEPAKRVFDWDNDEMKVLFRILDWAERRNVDVFLQQMWSNVAWNAYPSNVQDPIRRLRSGPYSMDEWAFGLGELLEHLVKVKKYTCIHWVSLWNEPLYDSFSWWQDGDMRVLPTTPGMKAAREEFDRRGLDIPITAYMDFDLIKLDKVDFDAYIGAYDTHRYDYVFDSQGGDDTSANLSRAEQNMTVWAKWAHAKNKGMFLTEFGTVAYGAGHDDPGPVCYQSELKNASLVVRGINAGIDGFNYWSFINRGDQDGQFQLVRTWDIANNKLLEAFTPQPNAYFQFAMLSRFLPKHCGVLATRVEGPYLQRDRKLVATALRTPKGGTTILLVNEGYHPADVNIVFDGLAKPLRLQRYSLTREAEDKTGVEIDPERSFEVDKTFADHVPALSIVVYSTYDLKATDPGLINE